MEARAIAPSHLDRARPEEEWVASYRTFARTLAPVLTAAGGLLTVVAGAGTWIRVTRLTVEGQAAEEAAVVAGHSLAAGRALIVLGVITLIGALAWLASDPPLKAIPVLASLTVIALAAAQLLILDGRAARMVEEAGKDPGFLAYHAAFGWGAWMLLLASVVLFLGSLIGVLREVDLRTLGREVDR